MTQIDLNRVDAMARGGVLDRLDDSELAEVLLRLANLRELLHGERVRRGVRAELSEAARARSSLARGAEQD